MSAVQCLRRGGGFWQFVEHLLRIEQKRHNGLVCDEEPLCLSGCDSSDGRSEIDGESEVSNSPPPPPDYVDDRPVLLLFLVVKPAGFRWREQKRLWYSTCGVYHVQVTSTLPVIFWDFLCMFGPGMSVEDPDLQAGCARACMHDWKEHLIRPRNMLPNGHRQKYRWQRPLNANL